MSGGYGTYISGLGYDYGQFTPAQKAQATQAWIIQNPQRAAELGMIQDQEQKAKERAEQIKQEYELKTSLEEKKRLSRLQNGYNAAVKSGMFQPEELEMLKKSVFIEAMDLPQNLVEKSERQKQEEAWAAEGLPVGGYQTDEIGNIFTRDDDGKRRLLIRYDQTPAFQERELQDKFNKYLGDQRLKLMAERNPDGSRANTNEEIESYLEEAYPQYKQQKMQQRMIEKEQEEAMKSIPWWQKAAASGATVDASDITLPDEVGQAQLTMRMLRKKYEGTKPPAGTSDYLLYISAAKIMTQYDLDQKVPKRKKIAVPRVGGVPKSVGELSDFSLSY